ncbi:MAG: ABC transporter ATP-binding protein [Armatimonadetes bacterium]|nr:ABC transporter ATP-binding protein [Armatimonadota bacterium]
MPMNNGAYAIETKQLTKRFGRQAAVDNLTVAVPTGSVFAFLGKNGAGKTTTIRMLMNLLDATSGDARVLGMDCGRDSFEIRKRIGYVGDNQRMYDWMTTRQIMWFCKGFRAGWNDEFASDLQKKLDLPDGKKISALSRGMQAKLALLLAMAFRPEVLILDEPTSGLDVVVRRDFIEGVIELMHEEGRTVFFSSHLVHEVERVADWVGIIDAGKLIWCSTLDELKSSVRQMVMTFDSPPESFSAIPGVLKVESMARQSTVTVRDYSESTFAAAMSLGPKHIQVDGLGLEDIFVKLVGNEGGE